MNISKKEALVFDDITLVPQYSEIKSRSDIDTTTMLCYRLGLKLKLGVITAPMDTICESEMAIAMGNLGGLGIIHRFMSIDKQIEEIEKCCDVVPLVGAAVGTKTEERERIKRLCKETRIPIILIDIAHGHCAAMRDTIKFIHDLEPNVHVMAGNICTATAARDLEAWGADSIRTGIGPGAACSTRTMSASGVPQATAIDECVGACNVPIIADGGIRYSGDVAKAIALGANCVMIGSMIAGTDETPGKIIRSGIFPNEIFMKSYRGSASQESKIDRDEEDKNIEGVSRMVSYRGSVRRIIATISDGLRSAMSYSGAATISEFQTKANFVRVTQSGIIEASPHGLLKQ